MPVQPTGGGESGGGGGGGLAGGIGAIMGAIFDSIFSGATDDFHLFASSFIPWVNNLLSNIWKAFTSVAGIFSSVWGFLKHIWENYLKTAIDWLLKHVKSLIGWMQRHVKSLVDHLKKWKKWYDQHILPFQLKQLALIQHIRQVLGILKAFHVKWATQLDQKLGDLQSRIVGSIELIRGSLNSIINFANLIFDPSLLMRKTALGGSLLNMLGGLKRIAGFGSGLGMTKAQKSQMEKDRQMYTKSTVLNNVQTRAATGLTEDDRQARIEFQTALSEVTGVSL